MGDMDPREAAGYEYLIYRNHLGGVSDAEAERYRKMVEEALGVPARLVEHTQGVGSGLQGADSEERDRAHEITERIWNAGKWQNQRLQDTIAKAEEK